MSAERRPPEGAASQSAGGPGHRVRQADDRPLPLVPYQRRRRVVGPPCGCDAAGRAHACGLELEERMPACPGRCHGAEVATLRYWGERFGACPCRLEGVA